MRNKETEPKNEITKVVNLQLTIVNKFSSADESKNLNASDKALAKVLDKIKNMVDDLTVTNVKTFPNTDNDKK